MKYICNHAGGKECGECKHNKPHGIEKQGKYSYQNCHEQGTLCWNAVDGGGSDFCQCYPVSK